MWFLVFLLFGNTALAQELDFNRAYSDYTFNLGLYQKAHSEYELARGQYLQSKTLLSQSKAQEATLAMLSTRDEVVKTYLTALRTKIREVDKVENRDVFYSQIDTEVSWHDEHKKNLPTAGTLQDLVSDSNEARDRFRSTELVAYKSLTALLSGKLNILQDTLGGILGNTRNKVAEIRASGDKNVDTIERWIFEVDGRIKRSEEKEIEARNIVNAIKVTEKDKGKLYSQAQSKLVEALLYLKEAESYLKQIIREIKTAD